MNSTTEKVWNYRAACEVVDVRDDDRSALSGVPKKSGPNGRYSHHHRKLRRHKDDSPANLVLLTGSGTDGDHGWVHSHVGEATVLGYIVPSWQEPSEIPIWRVDMFGMSHGWFLQVDDQLVECGPPDHHPKEVIAAALAAFDEHKTRSRLTAINNL